MADARSLTRQRLKEVLLYDEQSGVFTWAVDRVNAPKGKVAGCHDGHGYIIISVDGKRYMAHRLAMLYVHGFFPEEVDHQNHVRDDNRLINLRPTDKSGNRKNTSMLARNSSGVVGVSWTKRIGERKDKWEVRACGKFIGYFDDFFEAVCKRKSVELQLNFHPNHGA
jgi:hypothetical protein